MGGCVTGSPPARSATISPGGSPTTSWRPASSSPRRSSARSSPSCSRSTRAGRRSTATPSPRWPAAAIRAAPTPGWRRCTSGPPRSRSGRWWSWGAASGSCRCGWRRTGTASPRSTSRRAPPGCSAAWRPRSACRWPRWSATPPPSRWPPARPTPCSPCTCWSTCPPAWTGRWWRRCCGSPAAGSSSRCPTSRNRTRPGAMSARTTRPRFASWASRPATPTT
jgi:hypothetical protein